jgi:formylglycine-generating enzyme required for sulfatase activity
MPSTRIFALTKHAATMKRQAILVAAISLALPFAARGANLPAPEYVPIRAGTFTSVLPNDTSIVSKNAQVTVPAFSMRVKPVTNGEYLAFVMRNRKWQRGTAPRAFVDGGYLARWQTAITLGNDAGSDQPVTNVSWFAAQAFCEAENARLPTWLEWETAAAADAQVKDARADPAWRAGILKWYSQSSAGALPSVGGPANAYGVRDIHGLIWEWVDDFNALLVAADSRNQGDPDKLQFCGAGAISLADRDNYAVLMRIALLSSLSAVDSTRNLGFRCVRSGATTNSTEASK